MFKKGRKNEDEFPEKIEEFRSVRVYSNINGKEERYGYDYHRTPDGKEEYKEIGNIPDEFGTDIAERMRNLEKRFSVEIPIFDNTESLFNRMLSGFGSLFTHHPALAKPEITAPYEADETVSSKLQYDVQVDPKTNIAHIIIELPGFSKKDIKLRLTNKGLYLKAHNNRKDVEATIPLKNLSIRAETMKATMKNGILEVTAELNRNQPDEGKEIPIN